MTTVNTAQSNMTISGGMCLLPCQGLVAADLHLSGGVIAEIAAPTPRHGFDFDARNCLVLPGIVDIHGDAFERQIMPRPGTLFPLDIAMLDTDRQLASNGITTAYHGVTVSWEPGLRSLAEAQRIVTSLSDLQNRFSVDNRLHIRWETFAVDALPAVASFLTAAKVPILAFNDHTTTSMPHVRNETKLQRWADRAMVSVETYRSMLCRASERAGEVPAIVRAMCAAAVAAGVPLLSHDDDSAATRQEYRAQGAAIAEFPLNWETLDCAAAGGDDIVLGAPNVVRGGSHNGAIGAELAIARGRCTILASDYYYPAPLAAALMLAERQVLTIEQAWDLVSSAPARACRLQDRGRIAEGLRADLVIIPIGTSRPIATLVSGRIVYACR